MSNESKKPDLHAYTVTGSEDKPFYTKIGAAWEKQERRLWFAPGCIPCKWRNCPFPAKGIISILYLKGRLSRAVFLFKDKLTKGNIYPHLRTRPSFG